MVPTLPGKRRQQRHSTHLPRLHSKNTAEPGFTPTLSAQFPMLWTIWAGLPQLRIFYLLLMTKGVGPTCPLRSKDPLVIWLHFQPHPIHTLFSIFSQLWLFQTMHVLFPPPLLPGGLPQPPFMPPQCHIHPLRQPFTTSYWHWGHTCVSPESVTFSKVTALALPQPAPACSQQGCGEPVPKASELMNVLWQMSSKQKQNQTTDLGACPRLTQDP